MAYPSSVYDTVVFFTLVCLLTYNLLKSWRGDAGVIRTSPDEKMRTIVRLAERGAQKGTAGCFDPKESTTTHPVCALSYLQFGLKSSEPVLFFLNLILKAISTLYF